jgi:hypothetical protein
MKLKRLAVIQMGYSFRSRLEASVGGDVAVIQMKDLLDDNTVDCDDLVKIDLSLKVKLNLCHVDTPLSLFNLIRRGYETNYIFSLIRNFSKFAAIFVLFNSQSIDKVEIV